MENSDFIVMRNGLIVLIAILTLGIVGMSITHYSEIEKVKLRYVKVPDPKPTLYITAVTPYILLNTKDGIMMVTLDKNLNERVFKFSNEKETARFLSDISLNFEIVDYTGVYK